jgi:ammonium transporter
VTRNRTSPWLALLLVFWLGPALAFANEPPKPADPTKPTPAEPPPPAEVKIDGGDTAWMLVSTGLVMFMVPGLALFYGGIVRRKNVLGTMMQSMVALGLIGVLWVLVGYSLAFGTSRGGYIGWDPRYLGLQGVMSNELFPGTKIPIFVHCMYQGMFAIITPALISGALAERIKFSTYCIFIALWSLFVYAPLAHWVWAVDDAGKPAGWLGKMGALDFAGGTVVHIAAGFSGLAAILVLRKRVGYPEHAMHPNSVVLTLLGAGMLWFGWFGFNGGSALGSSGLAGAALTATQCGAAAAALTWMLAEWFHRGKPTALGLATGLVAGLVAITPASGFVKPLAGLAIGAIAGVVCYLAVCLKPTLKYDDSLDAFGVHGIGGFLGAILTGVFASAALWQAGADTKDPLGALGSSGLDYFAQIKVQALAALASVAFAFAVSLVLVKVLDLVMGFGLTPTEENDGLDQAAHGEVGFDFGFGPAGEVDAPALPEPKPAAHPPDQVKRYTVIVEGAAPEDLMEVWSALCLPNGGAPSADFKVVFPHVTTVQGNRFRFRGGEPQQVAQALRELFAGKLRSPNVRARVEA